MAVSGLVITLELDQTRSEGAMRALAGDRRLTLGPRFGQRLSAVAETPSPQDDRDLCDALRGLPGVAHVDIAFVGVDPPTLGDQDHDDRDAS